MRRAHVGRDTEEVGAPAVLELGRVDELVCNGGAELRVELGVQLPAQAGELAVAAGELLTGEGGAGLELGLGAQSGGVDLERVEAVAGWELVGDLPHAAGGVGVLVLVGAGDGPGAADVLGGRVLPPGVAEHALQLRERLLALEALAVALCLRAVEAVAGGVSERLLAGADAPLGQARAEQQAAAQQVLDRLGDPVWFVMLACHRSLLAF
jgi:hypothetical protein